MDFERDWAEAQFGCLIEEWPTLDPPRSDDVGVQDGETLLTLTEAGYRAKVAANRAARIRLAS